MSIVLHKDVPKEGQFVAIWEHKGQVWSVSLRLCGGVLQEYRRERDYWLPITVRTYPWEEFNNLIFFTT